MTFDLRTARVVLLLVAAILFFAGAGLGIEHARKTLIVWGVGFGLVTLDRLVALAIETLWHKA
jgi:disulfide bond formation protein DsbB